MRQSLDLVSRSVCPLCNGTLKRHLNANRFRILLWFSHAYGKQGLSLCLAQIKRARLAREYLNPDCIALQVRNAGQICRTSTYMKLTVIIPSYRRPTDLDRCLKGLAAQRRVPDQIIVVLREEDRASVEVASKWFGLAPLETRFVGVPGVVQALNLALDFVTGDVVTITDDDTFALEDWLERIEAHFSEAPDLGGLGGRDLIHENGRILPATGDTVGRILPFGRLVGNHHAGSGEPREVDHLKGVNMSWRVAAIQGRKFDESLRGSGAQVYFELAFSLDVKRSGWRLLYDPGLQVHHFLAKRFDHDARGNPDLLALENAAFNLHLSLRRYMSQGPRRRITLLWVYAIGGFGHPGVLRGLWFRLTGNDHGRRIQAVTAKAWREAKKACSGPKQSIYS